MKFAELQLGWDMRHWQQAQEIAGPVFFDRGVVDCAAYLTLCGLEVPPPFERAAHVCRYNPVAFIAPPWREIYENDAERKQDFAEAVRTFEAVGAAYEAHGYTLVELPKTGLAERVAFVLDTISG